MFILIGMDLHYFLNIKYNIFLPNLANTVSMTNILVAKTCQVRNRLVFYYKILNEVTPFARYLST